MVPQATGGTTIEDRLLAGRNGGRGPTRPNPTSSRVACLRQHYSGQKLLTEATDLLLLSWRPRTSQLYDSLCKKWIDPVSGPIENVVNFLAHLQYAGYQYQSL